MPARLITKCPECDRVTGDCIDSSLDSDRTEYDGKRCRVCTGNQSGKPLSYDRIPNTCGKQAASIIYNGKPE